VRILYFTRDYTSHDYRFLAKLTETGYEVYYLRLERRGHSLEDRPLPGGVRIVPWAGGQKPFRWRDFPTLLTDLKRVIRAVKPDVIQAGPLQTTAFLVALSGFRRLVSMSWGYDLLIDADRNLLWRWVTRYTLRRSAAMVGDCNTIQQRASFFGMPAARIVAFPWGVDLRHFSPASPPAARPFTLLSARGWEPIYGIDLIARAFVQAGRDCPELRLIMLGNGSQAARLRQIFMQGDVLERVTFPGQVSYADLPRYYRMADLYLSASHSDGTSISLLEAMACGRPVLVSDISGNREWVTAGDNGWLFPDGNADALATTILHAFKQREHLPEMGRAARSLAEARADWEKNFPQLFKAYEITRRQ
jgi:glycosyltransferase involved in cell wall biosynthesis